MKKSSQPSTNERSADDLSGFDVMKWLRGVRDANHERLGHLPPEEYAHQLSEEGRQTPQWKMWEERAARRKAEREAAQRKAA